LLGVTFPEVPQPSSIEVELLHNWEGTKSHSRYERMNNECKSSGNRMCTVNTRTKFTTKVGDQSSINYVTEVGKPVCFPPNCQESDVSILEKQPARCDEGSNIRPCEILGYSNVTCPEDRTVVDDGNTCKQTMSLTSAYFIQRNILEARLNAACSSSSDWCDVDVLPIQVRSLRDYSAKQNNEYYKDYVNVCDNLGGKVCEVMMTTNQKAERDGLGEVDFRRTYFQMPLCMAEQCEGGDEPEVVKKRFVDSLSGVPCNLSDGSCTVDVKSVDCDQSGTFRPTIPKVFTPSPSIAPTIETISGQCREANSILTPKVLASYAILTAKYPDIPEPSDPIRVTTVQHWDEITENNVQKRMEERCEANTDHKICTVNTVVEYSEEIGGQAATNRVAEMNKPVCMPPTCADSDIAIIDTTPGRCNEKLFPCEIISYDLTCPDDRIIDTTSTTACVQNMDILTDPFFLTRNVLESRIQASCLSGGSGRFCTVNTADLFIVSSLNYTGYETDDAYLTYEDDCTSNQGQVCHVNLQVLQDSPLNAAEALDVTVTAFRTYTDFPVCVAAPCDDEDIKEVVKRRVPACDLDSGNCQMEIQSINCDGIVPTRSPSPTPAPTANAISETCRDSDTVVTRQTAPQALLFTANYTDIPEPADPIQVTTTQYWSEFEGNGVYKRMKNECEDNTDHSLCTVNTRVVFATSLGGQDASNTIFETNKPVCMPPICPDTQVAIIEANPSRCDNGTLPCTVESIEVSCPADRTIYAITNTSRPCEQNMDTITNPFFLARTILETRMVSECGVGGGSLCNVKTEDVVIKSKRDYTGYETDNAYVNYFNSCVQNDRGQMCHVDMEVTQESERTADTTILSVQLKRTLLDFPICVSSDCGVGTGNDNDEVMAVIKARVPACDINAACEVEVNKMMCVGNGTTTVTTPSPVTRPPTISPVKAPTVVTTPTTTGSPIQTSTQGVTEAATTSGGSSLTTTSTRGIIATVVASFVCGALTLATL